MKYVNELLLFPDLLYGYIRFFVEYCRKKGPVFDRFEIDFSFAMNDNGYTFRNGFFISNQFPAVSPAPGSGSFPKEKEQQKKESRC